MGSSNTFVKNVQFNEVDSFKDHSPSHSSVDVTVEDMSGHAEMFAVDLVDGKFDSKSGSIITAIGSDSGHVNQPEESDFDLNVIVKAAEQFVDQNTRINTTSTISDQDRKIKQNAVGDRELTQTTFGQVRLGSGRNFRANDPLGAKVDVDAYNEEGKLEIFTVELTDRRYRPEFGCKITADSSDAPYIDSSDYPEYDLRSIVQTAEQFMEQNTVIRDTGFYTDENDPVRLIVTPNNSHIAPEDAGYINHHESANQRFKSAIATFE